MTHRIRGFDAAAKFATLATPRAGHDENCEIAGVRASFGAIYRNRSAQTFVCIGQVLRAAKLKRRKRALAAERLPGLDDLFALVWEGNGFLRPLGSEMISMGHFNEYFDSPPLQHNGR